MDNTDVLFGRANDDLLVGNLGGDTLLGGTGSDILVGGPEKFATPNSDVLIGDWGNDINIWAPGDGSDAFIGDQGYDTMIFAPFVDDGGKPLITWNNGRKVPRVDIDNQAAFSCTIVPVPASQKLGFQFLVRFNVNGTPVVTVRQRNVEKVFCPSPLDGKARVADLTADAPGVPRRLAEPGPRHHGRDPRTGGVTTMASRDQHAVVIGASMSGLLAARSLTTHFDRVTVVDRDEMPHEPVTRGGVPQGRHTHGLLARGREVIEELFPGTTADLEARGALRGDAQADVRWHFAQQPLAPGRCGLELLAVSRPLLEWYVRYRLLADAGVEILQRTSVLDLSFTAGDVRVDGVLVTGRDGGTPRLLPADLVVDASGRTSRTPEWLERRGYPTPPEDVRRIDKHYATRQFRRSDSRADDRSDDRAGCVAIAVAATPAVPRGGVMVAQEGDRWTVSLSGRQCTRPPTDLDGFIAYARSCVSPAIAEAIEGLTPLDEGMTYRFPANRRRHYERLTEFPEGLLVTGDALCAFDPVYGQGMTVAALEAKELGRCLAEGRTDLARRFHSRAAEHIDTPWTIAVGAAPRAADLDDGPPLGTRMANAYLARLICAARNDPKLAAAFLRVNNLADRPADLLRPSLAVRVARGSLRRRGSRVGSRQGCWPRHRRLSNSRPRLVTARK